MTTSYANLLDCQTEQQRIRALLAAAEAERDAARAGEARAMEELKSAYYVARQWHTSVEWEIREYTQALIDACDAVLEDSNPALDWLAQQRAEAAAKEVERIAANHRELPGLIQCDVRELQQGLRDRAAALRAGKGVE